MEEELLKINMEKESKMTDINNHGDKFTEIIDKD
jgi:hypothetical protein